MVKSISPKLVSLSTARLRIGQYVQSIPKKINRQSLGINWLSLGVGPQPVFQSAGNIPLVSVPKSLPPSGISYFGGIGVYLGQKGPVEVPSGTVAPENGVDFLKPPRESKFKWVVPYQWVILKLLFRLASHLYSTHGQANVTGKQNTDRFLKTPEAANLGIKAEQLVPTEDKLLFKYSGLPDDLDKTPDLTRDANILHFNDPKTNEGRARDFILFLTPLLVNLQAGYLSVRELAQILRSSRLLGEAEALTSEFRLTGVDFPFFADYLGAESSRSKTPRITALSMLKAVWEHIFIDGAKVAYHTTFRVENGEVVTLNFWQHAWMEIVLEFINLLGGRFTPEIIGEGKMADFLSVFDQESSHSQSKVSPEKVALFQTDHGILRREDITKPLIFLKKTAASLRGISRYVFASRADKKEIIFKTFGAEYDWFEGVEESKQLVADLDLTSRYASAKLIAKRGQEIETCLDRMFAGENLPFLPGATVRFYRNRLVVQGKDRKEATLYFAEPMLEPWLIDLTLTDNPVRADVREFLHATLSRKEVLPKGKWGQSIRKVTLPFDYDIGNPGLVKALEREKNIAVSVPLLEINERIWQRVMKEGLLPPDKVSTLKNNFAAVFQILGHLDLKYLTKIAFKLLELMVQDARNKTFIYDFKPAESQARKFTRVLDLIRALDFVVLEVPRERKAEAEELVKEVLRDPKIREGGEEMVRLAEKTRAPGLVGITLRKNPRPADVRKVLLTLLQRGEGLTLRELVGGWSRSVKMVEVSLDYYLYNPLTVKFLRQKGIKVGVVTKDIVDRMISILQRAGMLGPEEVQNAEIAAVVLIEELKELEFLDATELALDWLRHLGREPEIPEEIRGDGRVWK